jgi:adenylosuccinate synthase
VSCHAIIVIDLAFGDCGKGTIVDYLVRAREAHTVVRFNGGPQAGHNVVLPDGRHHTFSQFGSGTFVDGVRTFLSRFMLIEPYAMLNEAAPLEAIGVRSAWDRMTIDPRCKVITPIHQAANRIREVARGDRAHGTCGMGVGELMADHQQAPQFTLTAARLTDHDAIARCIRESRRRKLDELSEEIAIVRQSDSDRARQAIATLDDTGWLDAAIANYRIVAERVRLVDEPRALRESGTIIFEGAQGVLLDEAFGFHPHTTWSTTTAANAEQLLRDANFQGRSTTIGVLRTYFTRHGSGPFVTEDRTLKLPEPHNVAGGWQGAFRVGAFDAVAARYALSVAGRVDALAITHLDRLPKLPALICTAYRDRNGTESRDLDPATVTSAVPVMSEVDREATRFLQRVSHELNGLSIAIESFGPTWCEKRVRSFTA